MDAIKKILTISVLVGLLAGSNSAIAQLAIELTPVPGAPTGYRTYDIDATTTTNLGAMELVFDTSDPAGIYHVGSPSPIEASGGTYDTYLTMPVDWQVISSAVDINSDPQAWSNQNLNKMWAPLGGQQSGPGTFQVGRLTLANWASASYTIMGWEGGQTGSGSTAAGTLEIPQMGFSVVPGTGGPSNYDRYYDFYADVNTNLGAMELLFNTNNSAGIYQVSSTANDPDNADVYDSYVSTGYPTDGEQPANTALLGAALDIAGTSGVQTFNTQDIDLMWAPTGGTQTGHGQYHVGRVTVADAAAGSWTLKGWQGGGYDAVTISGGFTEAEMELSVVEGTGSGIDGSDRYLDFYADVNTNLGAMELLLNTNKLGGIHQVSLTADDPDNADAYDSYVSTGYPTDGEQPANTALLGAALDIAGTSGVQTFDTQDIDLMWAPTGGTQTGDGLFHVGRVTLADAAAGSWTLKGWQGGDFDAVAISGDFTEVQMELSVVEGTGSGIDGYDRYLDFYADVNTNLGAMELLLNTDTLGDIYQNSLVADDPDNADTYDSYVSTGYPSDGEQPANTALLGAALDIAGTSGVQTFDTQDIDLMWAPTGGTQTGDGLFHIGRVTLADTATGSWTLKGWQGGDFDAVAISDDFTEAEMELSVVEGTGSGIDGYDRYLDFYADVNTDLGALELLLNTDTLGDIYQNSLVADDPDNADAYDSYVSTGYPSDGEQPANTELLSAAVDIAGTSGVQTFDTQDIDLLWAPTGGTQTGDGLFHIGRVTLADTATGSWILMGWQGGDFDAVTITGDIFGVLPGDVNGDGFVDGDDLTAIISNWGLSGGASRSQGDLNGDGSVNAADYTEVLGNWAPPEPPQATPEPAALAVLLISAGPSLLARRPRK